MEELRTRVGDVVVVTTRDEARGVQQQAARHRDKVRYLVDAHRRRASLRRRRPGARRVREAGA